MKKLVYFAAVAVSMISMASCSGNKCGDGKCAERPDEVYSGILPAADADGISYTLKLDYDDDKGNKEGDYDLNETVLTADSTGFNHKATYLSEGDFTVMEKDGKKYIKLVKDAKESNASAASTLTFLVSSDSTLTMVNDQTLEAAPDSVGLNYTLKLTK